MDKFLFITVPNNSGSKLIVELLKGCKNIIALPREGERFVDIPRAASRLWTQTKQLEDMLNENNYNFTHIRTEWMKLWEKSAHYDSAEPKIFMEKSPPNVLRAQMYEKHFPNSYFIIMVRNPYAFVEGIIKRCPKKDRTEEATNHWVETTKKQIENVSILKNNLVFTYEALCDSPKKTEKLISTFLPELADVNLRRKVTLLATVIGPKSRSMAPTNLNERQIEQLSASQINTISNILKNHTNLLDFFGYKIL